MTKPIVVSWSLGGLIVPDVLSRFGISPLPVAGHVMLNAVPWRSISREISKPYSATVIPSITSPHTTEFQNALKLFIGAFVAPGNSISFEDRCAWIGSAAGMVSLAYLTEMICMLIGEGRTLLHASSRPFELRMRRLCSPYRMNCQYYAYRVQKIP